MKKIPANKLKLFKAWKKRCKQQGATNFRTNVFGDIAAYGSLSFSYKGREHLIQIGTWDTFYNEGYIGHLRMEGV